MADDTSAPTIPPLAPPAPGAVSVGAGDAPPAAAPSGADAEPSPVPPPAPTSKVTPDAITLTKRELDECISLAVAAQVAQRKDQENKQMAEDQTAAEIAELKKVMAAQQEQITAALKAQKDTADQLALAEKARAEADKLRGEAEEQAKKTKIKAKQRVVEATLKAEASQAGIEDADYALVLYARAVTTCMSKDPPVQAPDSKVFFAGLKATNPGIFKTAPAGVPAETGTGGDGQPPPAPPKAGAAAAQGEETVDDLNHQKFAERTRNKYGYNPSIS